MTLFQKSVSKTAARRSEVYPGLPQLSKLKSFAVTINGFQPSTIIANFSVVPIKIKVSSKQNVHYKDSFQYICRPPSAYLLAKFQGKLFVRDSRKFQNTLEGYCKNKRVLAGFFEILMVTCIAIVEIMELTFLSVT